MSKQTNKNRFFHRGALVGILALSGIAGCGEGQLEPTASAAYALTGHVAGPYGSTGGTAQGPGSDHLTPVTYIIGYGNSSYVFGIKLFWGSTSLMYGQTNGLAAQEFDLTDDPVTSVKYVITSNVVRGIRFANSSGNLALGLTGGEFVAFSDPNDVFTDMQTWQATINGTKVLAGAKFYYTTP